MHCSQKQVLFFLGLLSRSLGYCIVRGAALVGFVPFNILKLNAFIMRKGP